MFSIVTPSFRQLEWLRLAMASVADQQGVEAEHIVQDGGTEGIHQTFTEVVQSSGGSHYQAQLFVEKDQGMYDAINRGLKRGHGEICGYLNCDEQYLPGALAKVAAYFARYPDVDVLFGDAILMNAEAVPISYRRVILPSLTHLSVADLNTLTCATFFRRRVIEAGHFFPTHLKIAGDQYWVFQLLTAGIKMGILQEPLGIFAFTGENLTNTAGAQSERLAWLSPSKRPSRWMKPLAVGRHRMRKFLAGAYRWRDQTIHVYTKDHPGQRKEISARIGFRWPVT